MSASPHRQPLVRQRRRPEVWRRLRGRRWLRERLRRGRGRFGFRWRCGCRSLQWRQRRRPRQRHSRRVQLPDRRQEGLRPVDLRGQLLHRLRLSAHPIGGRRLPVGRQASPQRDRIAAPIGPRPRGSPPAFFGSLFRVRRRGAPSQAHLLTPPARPPALRRPPDRRPADARRPTDGSIWRGGASRRRDGPHAARP